MRKDDVRFKSCGKSAAPLNGLPNRGPMSDFNFSMNSTVARTLQKRRLDSLSQAPAVGEPNGAPAEEAAIVEASMFVGLAIPDSEMSL